MNVARQMLLQITLDVCGSVLGLSRLRVLDQPEVVYSEECLEGRVRITGEWELELRVVCPRTVAVRLTAGLYDKCEDDLSDEIIRDALSEVICKIGDDVKNALGGRNWLSFPRVLDTASAFDADRLSLVGDFSGDVLTVHLVDASRDSVCA